MRCRNCGETENFEERVFGTFEGSRNIETDEIEFYKVNVNDGFYECCNCYSIDISESE